MLGHVSTLQLRHLKFVTYQFFLLKPHFYYNAKSCSINKICKTNSKRLFELLIFFLFFCLFLFFERMQREIQMIFGNPWKRQWGREMNAVRNSRCRYGGNNFIFSFFYSVLTSNRLSSSYVWERKNRTTRTTTRNITF